MGLYSDSNTNNAYSCKTCPVGKTQDGNPDKENCKACQTGFGTMNGVCQRCPAGKFVNDNDKICVDCAIGKRSNAQTNYLCVDCAVGRFADQRGTAVCTTCPAGKVAKSKKGFDSICVRGRGNRDIITTSFTIVSSETCRADLCTDYGSDCCAPGEEARGCSDDNFAVTPGGTSSYEPCSSTYGSQSIYQCCEKMVQQTQDSCAALCSQTEKCVAFDWTDSGQDVSCRLFSSVDSYDSNPYVLVEEEMKYGEAKVACPDGLSLATICSEAQAEAVLKMIRGSDATATWIGKLYENGKFGWVSGATCSYENWAHGQGQKEKNGGISSLPNGIIDTQRADQWYDRSNGDKVGDFLILILIIINYLFVTRM